jgi:hypothetical protein
MRAECARIVATHGETVLSSGGADSPPWKQRHLTAWNAPSQRGELAVRRAIEAYAAWADDYAAEFAEAGGMGRDGYFGEHAAALLGAIHASLSMGFKSRLDSGAISRLLHDLARSSGVSEDF